MTPQTRDRLRQAGGQIMAARKRLEMNRAELAVESAVSEKSIARLEAGKDVRLSTYLDVADGLAKRTPSVVGLTERVAALPESSQIAILQLVSQLERTPQA